MSTVLRKGLPLHAGDDGDVVAGVAPPVASMSDAGVGGFERGSGRGD